MKFRYVEDEKCRACGANAPIEYFRDPVLGWDDRSMPLCELCASSSSGNRVGTAAAYSHATAADVAAIVNAALDMIPGVRPRKGV